MAIREKGDSLFARGLEKTKAFCPDEMVHCFQHDQTRHVTMFSGQLTASEVRNLKFRGKLAQLSISFAGWQPWISCCLMLTHESQNELMYLLSKIESMYSCLGKFVVLCILYNHVACLNTNICGIVLVF